jgi:hypothetical protein
MHTAGTPCRSDKIVKTLCVSNYFSAVRPMDERIRYSGCAGIPALLRACFTASGGEQHG